MAVRAAIVGASGKMGRALVRLAPEHGLEVVCAVAATDVGADAGELSGVGRLGVTVTDDMGAIARERPEVAVEFASPAATRALCDVAARARVAVVSGTTGLDEAATRALASAADHVAVLWEPNMSLGVFVLGALVERAIAMLGPDFDVEIVEAHHRMKVDAPSGTAMRLADHARKARGGGALVHGREGRPGARQREEIGMHAVRGGDVVGDHTVMLLGQGERLELAHRASSRDVFARGALRAAGWIAGKPAGRYGLGDVLSLKAP
jgi:4-hydroxy-tetrahydrodipicolinate reductase